MSPFQRHRWFVAAAGITLAFAAVSLAAQKGPALTAFADLYGLILMLATAGIALANVVARPHERSFWALIALAFALWVTNQAAWTYLEIIRHQQVPEPFFFDIILFFHPLPIIAAVAWRPDLAKKEGKTLFSALNFLMLLGWWLFLYAFIVFPHQYVALNLHSYNVYYDQLYGLEHILLLAVLALAAWTSSGGWRKLYLHFFGAGVLYGINSQLLDRAAANNTYYSGSLYDVPLIATIAWMAAASWSARDWNLVTIAFNLNPRWKKLIPQLAMLAIVSLPVIGIWAALFDNSPAPSRLFRIYTVLVAMFALGTFVFLRQYLQDRALMLLLRESRRGYESQKQLQTQLVQKEKLASLGTLVAGAAHEIDVPLTAIMSYSERLWGAQERLTDEQNSLVRKIVVQAQRTRDLVADLLSFAQQAPGEKAPVDLSVLLSRGKQLMESRYSGARILVEVSIETGLPKVWGNVHQLFQAFIEIIENAMDALREAGGGSLKISAAKATSDNILSDPQPAQVIVQFSDTGPGIREPQRVFDPFYTTKPVGQGTGLGLSAVYGVVQDHNGHIACHNKPEGGALFVMRLPAAAESSAQAAGASGA
jgi:signal transduction histidine kinase